MASNGFTLFWMVENWEGIYLAVKVVKVCRLAMYNSFQGQAKNVYYHCYVYYAETTDLFW